MDKTEQLQAIGDDCFPGLLGIRVIKVEDSQTIMELPIHARLMAPNGFLHAGSIVSLADSAAGYGCRMHLPEGASGFTTVELKSNHLSTAVEGTIVAVATPAHTGRTTQVWDVVVTHKETAKKIALFRCTQMVLYPKV